MGLEWVEDREEGELWAATAKSHISESTGRVTKESPGPCCAHARGVGVPWHRPCPRGGQSPPGHPDIQALQSCSFPFCSHSPIFLFYLHCHLLALISSLAWGKLPKLDYRKVRARPPLPAAGPALPPGVLQ